MSTPVEELVSACFDDLRLDQRFVPWVGRAQEAGFPQLAKLFRALAACETVREAFLRKAVPLDAVKFCDYFVCPTCGLVYDFERPDQCLVDQTAGPEFILIH